jgi:uncharacterized protein (TIGR02284 family)
MMNQMGKYPQSAKLLSYAVSIALMLALSISGISIVHAANHSKDPVEKRAEVVAMHNDRIIKELNSLAQYEIDKSFMLNEAIESVNDPEIKKKLLSFKENAEKNISKLLSHVKELGGKPVSYSKDFKGYFMQGYVTIRGITSDVGVLRALHTNEKLVLSAYEKALKLNFPKDIAATIQDIYNENEELNRYLTEQIELLK